jgi:phytoene dehydrogenase-like protein
MSDAVDAVVVGSGPNGLGAAIAIAETGRSVLVLEGADELGGGLRSRALTLPGFVHDVCSACHPMAVVSLLFRRLDLAAHGLLWRVPEVSLAHPLDDGPAVLLRPGLAETARQLGDDARAYERLIGHLMPHADLLFEAILGPLRPPRHPIVLARFGLHALRSAAGLARSHFAGERARALFAGCAAHSILPLERAGTAALGLLFCLLGHVAPWPVAAGGSAALAQALARKLASLGGRIETRRWVRTLGDLPPARVYLFDTSPATLAEVAGPVLPARYLRRLGRYRYGPGVFKIDWALAGPIPWRDPAAATATTVHLGGTLDELAAAEAAPWRGEHAERPFVLLVQASAVDPTRAPPGQQTGWAYCHVPNGSTVDCTEAIERQVERFAPGFRERILGRHTMTAAEFARYNPAYVGGAITGGAADLGQLFTRPVARWNPYTTPNPRVFLCSAATPPGGGVHGMCGAWAARAALRHIDRFPAGPLA